jgi:hypothetical protein
VGYAAAEVLGATPLLVHVVRVEIAGLSGVQHDVGFCDGTPERLTDIAGFVVLKEPGRDHVPDLVSWAPL